MFVPNSVKTWMYNFILSSQFGGVTIDGVWTGELIYWPLIPITRNHKQLERYRWSPHFTNHYTLSLFRACCVFNSHSLATPSNSGDSSASHIHTVTVQWISHSWTHSAEQSRAEQKLTAGNQPASSILAPGPAGTHGHIFVQCQDLCFVLCRPEVLTI
jgi:hypothetical protein